MLTRLAAFLMYVAGFAAIPFLAKSFTGILGSLTGRVNDRTKGIIDRPRNALRDWAKKQRDGRKAAKRSQLFEDAAKTRGVESLNPLKRSNYKKAWQARRRLRAQAIQSLDRFKAGGSVPPAERSSGPRHH